MVSARPNRLHALCALLLLGANQAAALPQRRDGSLVSEIKDGQLQAPAATTPAGNSPMRMASQISDGQVQVPTGYAPTGNQAAASTTSSKKACSRKTLLTSSSSSSTKACSRKTSSSSTSTPSATDSSTTTKACTRKTSSSTTSTPTDTSTVGGCTCNSTQTTTPPVQANAIDPFKAIATDAPPSQITSKGPHPVPTLNIVQQDTPLHTNKFYANLFLGNQTNAVWTDPYSVTWANGGGDAKSWGLAVSHIDADQFAFGDGNSKITGSPASNLIAPIGIQSLILSATELGSDTQLSTDTLETFSVNANLKPSSGSNSSITFPLLQGVGFITGVYNQLTPIIQSGVGIDKVATAATTKSGAFKYQITTKDQKSWLMYASPEDGKTDPAFKLDNGALTGPSSAWSGTIQIGKNSAGSDGENIYDAAAGVYAVSCALTGAVTDAVGSYTFNWTTKGSGSAGNLLMYSLSHHQQSFDNVTTGNIQKLSLATTTAGNATAVIGSSWTMIESALPISMGFAPWTAEKGSVTTLSTDAAAAIKSRGAADVAQDMNAQTNINSFYYAGKALFKFAQVVWTLQNLADAGSEASMGLGRLKDAFEVFTSNKNQFPLVYDTTWKGAVSSAWQDSGADFGNSFYNDHHFHFGYFLGAAALVGDLDKTWLDAHKDYINTMARDVSNPSADDKYFPQFRSFDWYRGHSWAKGLFDSADGKDEESSSEDVMFAYGLKMWGKTIGDTSMEARGNLMLSVLARSIQSYILMADDNTVQPKNYIGNKAAGITFMNKLDHVTYFGANLEYVEGIHMLPLIPASALIRTKDFVQQEWDVYFKDGASAPASSVVGGWKGVLYANLALIDPTTSYKFFSNSEFDVGFLDGGASLTWYLAFAAGLGGAS